MSVKHCLSAQSLGILRSSARDDTQLHALPNSRRRLLLLAGSLGVASLSACTTTKWPSSTEDATSHDHERSVDASVDATLERLYATVKGSRELVNKANGVLVFPQVLSAGFWLGAQYGDGALRVSGRTEGYYKLASGSFGPQIGAQSKALIFTFLTAESLARFERLDGWAIGADATVAVFKLGANGELDTTTGASGVGVFVLLNTGLMAGVSLQGMKISRARG